MMESQAAPAATQAPAWLPIRSYNLALQSEASWQAAGDAVKQRDLGLGAASEGAMQGRLLRAARQADLPETLSRAGTHFHLFYVVQGQLTLQGPDGARTVLQSGDCIHQPALGEQQRITLSDGAEVLELAVPVKPVLDGRPIELEDTRQAAQPVVNLDRPEAYIQGDGPRSYFLYRDLGVAAATGRRVHIHILKATAPSAPGGTGQHKHSMCQLFYVFRGWADLEVEGHETVRMYGGDAMCISAGTHHNVPAFSADYAILELCIPADYDTVGT